MKKILLLLPILAMLAAGCNFSRTEPNDSAKSADTFLINKGADRNNYLVDARTGKLTVTNPDPDLTQFTGLPKTEETKNSTSELLPWIKSSDGNRIILQFRVNDKTKPISDFSGEYPTQSKTYYVCELDQKSCALTKLLDAAIAKSPELEGCWKHWDSENNLFYASPCGEGGGNNFVAKYDATKKTIQIVGNKYEQQGKLTTTYAGKFNSNLTKFYLSSEDAKTKKTSLLIYNTSDFNKPINTIDISSLISEAENLDTVYLYIRNSVWSPNGKELYFATTHNIYSVDLSNGNSYRIASEKALSIQDMSVSSGGRYLGYVSMAFDGTKQTIKSIDLQKDNKVEELLKDEFISFKETY